MSVLKKSNYDIQPFQFGQLVPQTHDRSATDVTEFTLKSLKEAATIKNNISDAVLRSERKFEAQHQFSIDPVVREHRGILSQEKDDYEKKVQEEVEKRLADLSQKAYQDGVNEGRAAGMDAAYKEALISYEEKISEFQHMLENLSEDRKSILESSRDEAYKLIKNLTKWIALKEVDDQAYIPRLLEKLILEMNTKSNLLIRVDPQTFQVMPEVLESLQNKIGQLINVRVEIEEDIQGKGIILESGNGIIDGTLEAQFASIDRLFQAVGINE